MLQFRIKNPPRAWYVIPAQVINGYCGLRRWMNSNVPNATPTVLFIAPGIEQKSRRYRCHAKLEGLR